ncbi:MAG: NAD/NADP octopine/nopaline dehydrogenase family protein [Lautropia sp.]
MTTVAILGNTHRNVGAACAADLALAGHAVRYALFDPPAGALDALRAQGGFDLQGDPAAYFSGRTGRAELQAICDTPAEALAGAEVVLIDVPMPELEARFTALLPALPNGAVVHVQSHGYWPAARLTPILRRAGRDDVLVTEAVAPTHAANLADCAISGTRRRGIEVATIPGRRIDEALAKLRPLFGDLIAAPSVLQTGLENLNLMVHPAPVLLGIGLLERADLRGEKVRFYRECNVPSAGKLSEALDAERGRVCAAHGVRYRTLPAAIDHYYGTSGNGIYEAILNCAAYQGFGAAPATTWRGWESIDVPYAIVPLVRLAEQAGVPVPLHRAMAEILGVVLGIDPWAARPTLADMELVGEPAALIARFG